MPGESNPVFRKEESKTDSTAERLNSPEKFLSGVQLDELNRIFDSISARTGKTEVEKDHASKDQVRFSRNAQERQDDGIDEFGKADLSANTITLYWDRISSSPSIDAVALHVLIHELTHLRARRGGVIEDQELPGNIYPARSNLGLNEILYTGETHGAVIIGHALDEAVTEKIAGEVLSEYIRRTGESANIQIDVGTSQIFYATERVVLEAIIGAIATRVGLARDVVWKGFVQSYLNGEASTYSLIASISEELNKEPAAEVLRDIFVRTNEPNPPMEQVAEEMVANSQVFGEAAYRVMSRMEPKFLEDALGLK